MSDGCSNRQGWVRAVEQGGAGRRFARSLERLANDGRLVVFPAYQSGPLDIYQTDNAAFAVRRAVAHTAQGWRGREVDWSGPVYVGHSAGGGIALNLAAMAGVGGLPEPRAVHAVEPVLNLDRQAPGAPDPLGLVRDMSGIPASTVVTLTVGDRDDIASDETAFAVWERIDHLGDNRRYQILRSTGGRPIANHLVPIAVPGFAIPDLTDAGPLDRLLWSTLEEMSSCVPGTACAPPPEALGDWPEGLAPADVFVGDSEPYRLTPNAGNGYAYVFAPIFARLAPFCPFLGNLCGVPPPS